MRAKWPKSLKGAHGQHVSIKRTKGGVDVLWSAVEEVDRVHDGEVGPPVRDFDQAVELAERGHGVRLLVVHARDLKNNPNGSVP